MTEKQKAIIQSLAKNDMNVLAVAKELHYHRNTIAYHIERIREQCGLNPLCFYDLVKLIEISKENEDA